MRVTVEEEIWAPIAGFPHYQISNFGRLWSNYKHIIMQPFKEPERYSGVVLKRLGKPVHLYVHRLVAIAFVKNEFPDERRQVNHIDGNKHNNHFSNLEWTTNSENMFHAHRTGLAPTNRVGMKPIICDQTKQKFDSIAEATRFFGAPPSVITQVLLGNHKQFRGYTFSYL